MPLTALIVDDEPLAREGLRMLLAEDPDFGVIQEARNGLEAIALITAAPPDIVFLDVQMPEMDGLAVVRQIGPEHMPALVFVTAFDQYAIQAFEINAVDYLLKPVTAARFTKCLDRVKSRFVPPASRETDRRILALLETIATPRRELKRIAVRSAGKTVFVDVDDIEWIEAAENYVQLHTAGGDYLLHAPMNTIEKSLDTEQFLRIHRSTIVNVNRIQNLQPAMHGEYVLTLKNGHRLQSSRLYNSRLKALAANPF